MKKYKNLIFDCDGTLLDSNQATVGAFNEFAKLMLKRGLTKEESEDVFHRSSEESLLELGIPTTTANMLKLSEIYNSKSGSIKFFDGMEEVLQKLKDRGVHMGMATNRNNEESKFALKENGIGKYITRYTCRDFGLNPKPSGDMIRYYLEKYNLKKSETIMLGNAIHDHLAAIDAGIDYAYCMWGTTTKHDEKAIELVNVEDILDLV